MATRRFGLSKGKTFTQVVESVGAAVNADDIEVTVDLAVNGAATDKAAVLNRLEEISDYITTLKWPPA